MKTCRICKEQKPFKFFNKDKNTKDGREGRCKSCVAEYFQRTKAERLKVMKSYHEANRNRLLENMREYYSEHKEKIKAQITNWQKEKYYGDATFRTRVGVTTRAAHAFRKMFGANPPKPMLEILGESYEAIAEYLENNPYGLKIMDDGVDFDHIIPLSTAKTVEELIELCHYTNIQLLESHYNRNIKRNSPFDVEQYEEWRAQTLNKC